MHIAAPAPGSLTRLRSHLTSIALLIFVALAGAPAVSAAQAPAGATKTASAAVTASSGSYPAGSPGVTPCTSAGFDAAANAALRVMRARAIELGIGGAAVVAAFDSEPIQAWSSKMAVVGRMKDLPSAVDKGSNLLAIAYAKAAEMADTLKDSGSKIRPPMTGEFGWSGGVIIRGRSNYLIAAFSGGKSEDDVQVSRAGIEELKARL